MIHMGFGDSLRRLFNDPVDEIKRTMAAPKRVSAGHETSASDPALEGDPQAERLPKSWDGYPTMRELAGEVDDRPEDVKNMERRQVYLDELKRRVDRRDRAQAAASRARAHQEAQRVTFGERVEQQRTAQEPQVEQAASAGGVEQQTDVAFYEEKVARAQRAADVKARQFGGGSWEAMQAQDELRRLKDKLARAKRSA